MNNSNLNNLFNLVINYFHKEVDTKINTDELQCFNLNLSEKNTNIQEEILTTNIQEEMNLEEMNLKQMNTDLNSNTELYLDPNPDMYLSVDLESSFEKKKQINFDSGWVNIEEKKTIK